MWIFWIEAKVLYEALYKKEIENKMSVAMGFEKLIWIEATVLYKASY